MAINMERFFSQNDLPSFDRYQEQERRIQIFKVQCHSCGFEPDDAVVPPRICPKCHSESWERFPKPGSILENANRYH